MPQISFEFLKSLLFDGGNTDSIPVKRRQSTINTYRVISFQRGRGAGLRKTGTYAWLKEIYCFSCLPLPNYTDLDSFNSPIFSSNAAKIAVYKERSVLKPSRNMRLIRDFIIAGEFSDWLNRKPAKVA